uniref:50S ribosomal protein L4 n=1 Tax=Heterorhabditis bacteriophora TaxID=37862 RepID=A0A1I7XJH8_HETBA
MEFDQDTLLPLSNDQHIIVYNQKLGTVDQ